MKLLQEAGYEPADQAVTYPAYTAQEMLDWLMTGTSDERFIDNIVVEMCRRLRASGVLVARSTLHFTTHHPQWLGARILWKTGMSTAEIISFDYGIERTADYLNSPVKDIREGASEVRHRLDEAEIRENPFYVDLLSQALTDYVAWPLRHTQGKLHVISFASDGYDGFREEDIAYLRLLLPALSLVSEIRLKNRITRTLLETYVGPHATSEILAGATTRGSGFTVGAAILISDLRDFSKISDQLSRDEVIGVLNSYFDTIGGPIERNGGEILKFMGDGLLAIFPLTQPDAVGGLLKSLGEMQDAMLALNSERAGSGIRSLAYGVGVHVGDVMYGNIGSQKRLDFTAIGPAVNVAARLEELTKVLKHSVLLSEDFVRMAKASGQTEYIGSYDLRGVSEPITVYGLTSSHGRYT